MAPAQPAEATATAAEEVSTEQARGEVPAEPVVGSSASF